MIRGVLASLVAVVIIGAGIGLDGPSHPNPVAGVLTCGPIALPIRRCSRVAG